jgi:4'-phosphopantetheinyl transferase
MSSQDWLKPPQNLRIEAGAVHIWRAWLDRPEEDIVAFEKILSADEKERASRFHFDRHRRRYICGRGILRVLLARYLDIHAVDIGFKYGNQGKPELSGAYQLQNIKFNLAHSNKLAIYAFAPEGEIGVDLEYIRQVKDSMDVAKRFFSANEYLVLSSLPEEEQQQAFFRCWTRKEAFIKALGEGLSYPLDRFDVSLAPGEPASLLEIEGSVVEATKWLLQNVHPGDGYIGALAVKDREWQMRHWDYTQDLALY